MEGREGRKGREKEEGRRQKTVFPDSPRPETFCSTYSLCSSPQSPLSMCVLPILSLSEERKEKGIGISFCSLCVRQGQEEGRKEERAFLYLSSACTIVSCEQAPYMCVLLILYVYSVTFFICEPDILPGCCSILLRENRQAWWVDWVVWWVL